MTGKQRALSLLAPLLSTALLLLLDLEGCLARPAGLLYDAAMRLRPAAAASREILLLDIDDRAIALTGAWPWTTDTLADGLAQLEELGAERVVLDFPLPDTATGASDGVPPAVTDSFDREFALMGENIRTLFDGIRRGAVPPKDAPRLVDDLVGLVDTAKARLLGGIAGAATGPDAELAGALRAFGQVWVAGGLRADRTADPVPAALAAAARGFGFTARTAETDGVLRSSLPMARGADRISEQVAFAALLERLGSPSLQAADRRLVLGGARPPGMPARDITLPLTDDGDLLLDWPGTENTDGFRHLSWGDLVELDWLEQDLVASLGDVDRSGLLGARGTALLDRYDDAATLRARLLADGGAALGGEWREARERFFALAGEALLPEPASDSPVLAEARRIMQEIGRSRESLRGVLEGSFCIVSLATRTVPGSLGRTPLGAVASGGSASAALVNTILTGRPLQDLPGWVGKAVGLLLALLATLAVLRLRARWTVLVGVLFAAAVIAGAGGLFLGTGRFVDPVVAAGSPALACAALAAARVIRRTPGRRTARQRFSARVPRTALRALVRAADHAPVDEGQRIVTVISARIGGLQGAAAAAAPAVFNRLHAVLGRVVVGLGGTVGRAEGDALEAFFGAPLAAADDAHRACRCVVRLQAALRELNAAFLAERLLAAPLVPRIGVASGPCLAGDLGMPGIPGYAVMGPAREAAWQLVLASERFGAGSLATGPVWEAGGKDLVARMLDRLALSTGPGLVRCVELVAEPETADRATVEAVGVFNEGLARLEAGDRQKAAVLFQRALDLLPGDGPSTVYALRCRAGS
jgi:adenylate cyclase